jgi:serine-type D-Ala-D-Ala carboxypeptidase (penicillin-binding protein 5/6)
MFTFQLKPSIKIAVSFNKDRSITILLLLIPVVLLSLYFLIYRFNTVTERQIERLKFASQLSANTISGYPAIINTYQPYISAESAIIMDDDSQVVLYSKNPTLRFAMASTTKIMTALVALEHFKQNDVIIISSDKVEGTTVGFAKGDKLYFIDVLYGMMLPSGNDAAYAIAENYPGGMTAFIEAMNKKAQDLHLYSTRYSDPAGLNDDNNYTSSLDLVRLTSVALKNKQLAEVVNTKSRTIATITGTKSYPIINLNKLLGYDGVVGVKTGFTEGAGGVLVTAKEDNGRRFIFAVIKSEDRFADTLSLLNYLRGNVAYEHFRYR